jgi:hypothetical protein
MYHGICDSSCRNSAHQHIQHHTGLAGLSWLCNEIFLRQTRAVHMVRYHQEGIRWTAGRLVIGLMACCLLRVPAATAATAAAAVAATGGGRRGRGGGRGQNGNPQASSGQGSMGPQQGANRGRGGGHRGGGGNRGERHCSAGRG